VLADHGIGRGDTVSVMLANTPTMLEAHYAVPMCGAVLHSMNTRLDATAIAFQLDHGESKVLIADTGFSETMEAALALASAEPWVIDYEDKVFPQAGKRLGRADYQKLVDRSMSGMLLLLITPQAPPETPKGLFIIIVALVLFHRVMPLPRTFLSTPCICGHYPCSIAMAGVFRGPFQP
jgi:acyl-CoA synthetase (AMP-forming)/AMP-acid ligase II